MGGITEPTTEPAIVVADVIGTNDAESLSGTSAAENIFGFGGNDTIVGLEGNDSLYGGIGDDLIYSDLGYDVSYGGAGNDTLFGHPADQSSLFGGNGDDFIRKINTVDDPYGGIGKSAIQNVYGGEGIDGIELDATIYNSWFDHLHPELTLLPVILGQTPGGQLRDFEYYTGRLSDFNDLVVMPWKQNSLDPKEMTLSGSDGLDTLFIDFASVPLTGGDHIEYREGVLRIYSSATDFKYAATFTDFEYVYFQGTSGNDILAGRDIFHDKFWEPDFEAHEFRGRDGDDTLIGGDNSFRNTLFGGNGNDVISCSYRIVPTTGHIIQTVDFLYGEAGNDIIDAGGAEDYVYGGTGNDTIYGGTGFDTIYGGQAADYIAGGGGNDLIYAGLAFDTVLAGIGNDVIYGEAGFDFLIGAIGNDTIYGGDGLDRMHGGEGADVLIGGADRDIMSGGTGGDIFVFDASTATGADVILDFESGDKLYFRGLTGVQDLTVVRGVTDVVITWDAGAVTLISAASIAVTMEFGDLFG